MKSSSNSSATPSSRSSDGSARRSFALTGPSVKLDPRHNAVRSDIADIRLADQVFAPHYASPMAMRVTAETALRAGSAADADIVARLNPGDLFEGLEFAGGNVWGIAPGCGQVGYVDAAMLTAVAP